MKLISMTDYVFLTRENKDKDNIRKFWACEKYAIFLKQPLTLEMFVPCDDYGNVLEESTEKDEFRYANGIEYFSNQKKEYQIQYQHAKSKVIFKDFYFKDSVSIPTIVNILQDVIIDVEFNNTIPDMTIEDLVYDNLDLAISF